MAGKETTRIDFYTDHVKFHCHICYETTRIDLPDGGRAYIMAGEPNRKGVKLIKEYAAAHLCLKDKTKVIEVPDGRTH